MEEDLKNGITDSVERILRYIIPGVAVLLLYSLSYPCNFNKILPAISENGLAGFLVILAVGMSIYVIYSLIIRFTLERIVFKCKTSPVNLFCDGTCLNGYSKAHAELLVSREDYKHYPRGYYTYLWSITHYAIILSILVIIFALVNEENSWFGKNSIVMGIIGICILTLSLRSYWYMQELEKDTMGFLMSKLNSSKESKNTTPK
jgi:hypothetical protein